MRIKKRSLCTWLIAATLLPPALHAQTPSDPDLGCWVGKSPSTQLIASATARLKGTDFSGGLRINLPPQDVFPAKLSLERLGASNQVSLVSNEVLLVPQLMTAMEGQSPQLTVLADPAEQKTTLDLSSPVFEDMREQVKAGEDYRLSIELPEQPRRFFFGLFGDGVGHKPRIKDPLTSVGEELLKLINPEPFKYPPSSPRKYSTVRLQNLDPRLGPLSPGSANPGQKADALVQIIMVTPSGAIPCVGSHLGDGLILTAHHCLQGQRTDIKPIILFGNISTQIPVKSLGHHNQSPRAGELECSAKRLTPEQAGFTLHGLNPDNPTELPDIGFLQVSSDFERDTIGNESRFRDASFDLKLHSDMTNEAASPEGPGHFSTAMIWTNNIGVNLGLDENGSRVAPQQNQKLIFRPTFTEQTLYNCQNNLRSSPLDICASSNANLQGRSRRGWQMGCPSIAGTSGSPVFEAQNTPAINMDRTIIGVMSSEADTMVEANCVAPAWVSSYP